MSDMITMVHPDVEGSSEVPEDAFEEVWEPLGWRRAQFDEDGNLIPLAEAAESDTATDDPTAEEPDGEAADQPS
jgi:hypothetical protein